MDFICFLVTWFLFTLNLSQVPGVSDVLFSIGSAFQCIA